MEPSSVPANERRVRSGGLMRCCLATISETTDPSRPGSKLSCKYESDPNNEQMIVAADGVWEWNNDMPDISATLVSKSDQLDNVDLMGGPRVFTIAGVTINEGAEQPLSIRLEEYPRPWRPGVTMRRLLAELWDTESDAWVGRRVRLFRDEAVKFSNVKPGGTRISHASHITKRLEVTLPTSKGKFGKFTVEPLPDAPSAPDDTASRASKAVEWFAAKGVSVANLEAHVGKPRAEWSDADVDEVKANHVAIVGGES